MNAAALAKLQQMTAELDAAVRERLAKHSDDDLMELVDAHLEMPELVLLAALKDKGYENVLAMAALSIYRERLRRAEVQLMEAT